MAVTETPSAGLLDLPDLPVGSTVVVDTETSGLHADDGATVSVVSVAWMDEEGSIQGRAWPFDQGTNNKPGVAQQTIFDAPNLAPGEFAQLLDFLERHWLVFHNAKYDLHMLRTGTRFTPGRCLAHRLLWCTMLGNKELDPTHPVNLDESTTRLGLTGQGTKKGKADTLKKHLAHLRKQHKLKGRSGRYDLAAWEAIEPYATNDAILTMALFLNQQERIEQGEHTRMDLEMRILKLLYAMEVRGVGFDVGRCMDAAQILQQAKSEVAARLPFKPTDAGAIEYYFGRLGLLPYEVTEKTKKPKLTEQIRAKMVKDGIEHIADYDHYCKLDTALSMWYEAYPNATGSDGRLRTTYRQAAVVSDRFSVERVNLQAIPHDYRLPAEVEPVRKMFVAKDGHGVYELDLGQAELRVATRSAKCARMRELIEQGADMHGQTAKDLFGVTESSPTWAKMRNVAKRGNFSFIFGVGWERFKADLFNTTGVEVSEDEAKHIVSEWRKLYPEYGRAIWRAQKKAEQVGHVRLAFGGRRWFRAYEDTHKAFNQHVQGSIAQLVKHWMLAADEAWPDTLLLQIHDSLIVELPLLVAERGVTEIAEIGAQLGTNEFKITMVVDSKQWA